MREPEGPEGSCGVRVVRPRASRGPSKPNRNPTRHHRGFVSQKGRLVGQRGKAGKQREQAIPLNRFPQRAHIRRPSQSVACGSDSSMLLMDNHLPTIKPPRVLLCVAGCVRFASRLGSGRGRHALKSLERCKWQPLTHLVGSSAALQHTRGDQTSSNLRMQEHFKQTRTAKWSAIHASGPPMPSP